MNYVIHNCPFQPFKKILIILLLLFHKCYHSLEPLHSCNLPQLFQSPRNTVDRSTYFLESQSGLAIFILLVLWSYKKYIQQKTKTFKFRQSHDDFKKPSDYHMLMHPYSYVYRVINKNICFYKCLRVRQHQKVTVNWQYTSCNLGQIILSVWKKYKLFTFLKYHTSQKCLVNECIIIKTLFYCLTTPPPKKKFT